MHCSARNDRRPVDRSLIVLAVVGPANAARVDGPVSEWRILLLTRFSYSPLYKLITNTDHN
jgi:hypothetical protein